MSYTHPSPLFLDFETQSACDIKTVGGRLYALHPSTRLLSLVVDIDGVYVCWFPYATSGPEPTMLRLSLERYGVPVEVWRGEGMPGVMAKAFEDARQGRPIVAHNAMGFDKHVFERFFPGISCEWCDTLYLARAAGLPGDLDSLGTTALAQGKDAGRRIAEKYFRLAKDRQGNVYYPSPPPGDLAALVAYNLADVILLRKLWEQTFATLEVEEDIIATHDRINARGVWVDTSLLRKISAVSAESVNAAGDAISEMTGGVLNGGNLRSTLKVHAWLEGHGLRITDWTGKKTLRKDVVEQCLAQPERMMDEERVVIYGKGVIPPHVFDVLRLRASALRITQAKADAAAGLAEEDGRVRGLFSYHQAHTGRWSSVKLQVHNLPRPKKGIDIGRLLELHESGEWGEGEGFLDLVRTAVKGKGLTADDAASALIRPSIAAAPGNVLCTCDYAAIECRGIAWLAGQENLIAAFRDGRDVYCEVASRIFGRVITKADEVERQVGKVTVLGCGYGMGEDKFALYCALQGIDLSAAGVTAGDCVNAFRSEYPKIAGSYAGCIKGRPYRKGGVWDQFNRAAMAAVSEGGVHEVAKTRWFVEGGTLLCELPSGRKLHYRNARIEDRVPAYAIMMGLEMKMKPTLLYDSPRYKETTLYGGKIAENVTQAVCRDLLAEALVRCEAAGLAVVLHVHDEIAVECPSSAAYTTLRSLASIMSTPPAWADGWPIDVEGHATRRFLKKPPADALTIEAKNGAVREH